MQKSTDVVIDSEKNIRISAQCTKTIADNRNKLNGLLYVSQYSKFEFRSLAEYLDLKNVKNMNDLLRKNNDQPTNIDVRCVQTVGLKHAKRLFVWLETNFFTFEAKCIILDNVCPIVEKKILEVIWKPLKCEWWKWENGRGGYGWKWEWSGIYW